MTVVEDELIARIPSEEEIENILSGKILKLDNELSINELYALNAHIEYKLGKEGQINKNNRAKIREYSVRVDNYMAFLMDNNPNNEFCRLFMQTLFKVYNVTVELKCMPKTKKWLFANAPALHRLPKHE